MQFAFVNNKRELASPGLTGVCQGCGESMMSKCGDVRIWHWSHLRKTVCDKWWERETLWHRNWKGLFSESWREKRITDSNTGEYHIADLCTPRELIIEFQHSSIARIDRLDREAFYKNMIWVVNGSRTEASYKRFVKGLGNLKPTDQKNVFVTDKPNKVLPRAWSNSDIPIFFDFENTIEKNFSRIKVQGYLWCLLPERAMGKYVILKYPKKTFLFRVRDERDLFKESSSQIVAKVAQYLGEQRRLMDEEFDRKFAMEIRSRRYAWRCNVKSMK